MKTSEGLKAYTKYLWFETKKRRKYIRITDDVQAFLDESGLRDGFSSMGFDESESCSRL